MLLAGLALTMQKTILLDTGHLQSKRSCGSRAVLQLTRQVLSCWSTAHLQLVTRFCYDRHSVSA